MTDKYVHTITKEEVEDLPMEHFDGRIFVLTTESEANKAVEYLQKFPRIGFDTETRPSFRKGRRYKVSLVQLSTDDTCFLFRLNYMGFPASLGAELFGYPVAGLARWHRGGQFAKDLRHFVREKNLQRTTLEQLGDRYIDRTTKKVCRIRRMGLPANL